MPNLDPYYNDTGKQLHPVKIGLRTDRVSNAKEILKNSDIYEKLGSLDKILSSMNLAENDYTSEEFKLGIHKIALIRLILSGKIVFANGSKDSLIGKGRKLIDLDNLKPGREGYAGEKSEFERLMRLIERGKVENFDFHYRGGLRRLLLDMIFIFIGTGVIPGGVFSVIMHVTGYEDFHYVYSSIDGVNRGGSSNLETEFRMPGDYIEGTDIRTGTRQEITAGAGQIFHSSAELYVYIAGKLAVKISKIVQIMDISLVTGLIIMLVTVYFKSSNDKQLVINALIKLIDIYLSDERILSAFELTSANNGRKKVNTFFEKPIIRLIGENDDLKLVFFKYINNLRRLYVATAKARNADKREELKTMKFENFVSDDVCGICLEPLTVPNMDVLEACKNHHRFHAVCLKQLLNAMGDTCPLCREPFTRRTLEILNGHVNTNRGGSRRITKRTNRKTMRRAAT